MLSKKWLYLTLGATLVANANATTEITWWHAMGGQLGETVNKIANDFNASQNQCKLNPAYKGSYEELLTASIAAFRAKKSPNIIQVHDAGSATIINAEGVVVGVEDLMQQNNVTFDKNDYIAGVRNFYADSKGKMIGMPFNSSTPVLYYNQEILDKVGVKAPKTWEEFEVVAKKLKDAGYTALSESHTPWIFAENFMSHHNLQLADQNNGYDGAAKQIYYNNPDMVMMFKKLKEWKDKGYFNYYGSDWGPNQDAFEKGDVVLWLGSSGSFGGIKQKVKFKFATAFLPYWDSLNKGKEYNTFVGGAALFAMSNHSKPENQCTAQFFNYLSTPDVQAFWHKETGYVPVTHAAYEKVKAEGYYQKEPAAETGVLQLDLPSGEWTKGYRLGYYPQIRVVMNREFDKIFDGSKSPEDALKTIQVESDKLLARFAQTVEQ